MDTYTLTRDVASEHPVPDNTISSYRETLLGKAASWQFEREKKFLHWWLQLRICMDDRKWPNLFDVDQNYGLCHRVDRETSGTLLVGLPRPVRICESASTGTTCGSCMSALHTAESSSRGRQWICGWKAWE